MKVLVVSTVFPNKVQRTHGLFVFERIRHAAQRTELRVLAPIAWRLRWRHRVPRQTRCGTLAVEHPTFFYLPGILKCLDGVFLFLSVFLAVRRIRREFEFDLIDAHFAYPEGYAAILLGRWFRCPVTVTMRGTEIPLSRYRLRKAAIGWTLRRATRVIAVAAPLAACALQYGVRANRLSKIANGVDIDRFVPRSQGDARKALGLPHDGKLLVSVGHLSPRKGFQRVLQVLPDVIREMPETMFAIVGGSGAEADNEAALRRLTEQLQLSERVIFAGPRPPGEVAQWLNAADVFVLASDYEGCPNAVWEALACGRPVIAARVGEVESMVPLYTGIIIDDLESRSHLCDAICQALRRRWDVKRIRAHAESHTWHQVAEQVIAQWTRALEQPAGAAGAAPDRAVAPSGSLT